MVLIKRNILLSVFCHVPLWYGLLSLIVHPAAYANNRTAEVIEIEGELRWRPNRRSFRRRISEGAELSKTDLIHPASGARVTLRCPDGNPYLVEHVGRESSVTNTCPREDFEEFRNPNFIVRNFQTEDVSGIPYIISPRSSHLINERPSFRWNPVADAVTYTIGLFTTSDTLVWETDTTETEISYPENQASLKSGVRYYVKISADNGQTSDEANSSNLSFRLLFIDELASVEATSEQIKMVSEVSERSRLLSLSNFYSNGRFDLTSEVIDILELLWQQDTGSPYLHRLLGDAYHSAGLRFLAEDMYCKAIDLAVLPEDRNELAAAALGLGLINKRLSNLDSARYWLTLARDSYLELDNKDAADSTEQHLNQL